MSLTLVRATTTNSVLFFESCASFSATLDQRAQFGSIFDETARVHSWCIDAGGDAAGRGAAASGATPNRDLPSRHSGWPAYRNRRRQRMACLLRRTPPARLRRRPESPDRPLFRRGASRAL